MKAATKSHEDELKALAEAKKVIVSEKSEAEDIAYGLSQTSLLQLKSGSDFSNFEAVPFVREITRKQKSSTLEQLDSLSMLSKSHSGGILDVLEDMKETVEEQFASLRKTEVNAKHNFAMLKQSLEDQLKFGNKDVDDETVARTAASDPKPAAEGCKSRTEGSYHASEKTEKGTR